MCHNEAISIYYSMQEGVASLWNIMGSEQRESSGRWLGGAAHGGRSHVRSALPGNLHLGLHLGFWNAVLECRQYYHNIVHGILKTFLKNMYEEYKLQ